MYFSRLASADGTGDNQSGFLLRMERKSAPSGLQYRSPQNEKRIVDYYFLEEASLLWPRSNPYTGCWAEPEILMGTKAPFPCLEKNGSASFSKNDLNPVVVCESLACILKLP